VPALREGIGTRHHEEDAVQHDLRVEHPGVRGIQYVAGKHFPGNQQREPHDGPGEKVPGKGAHAIDHQQEFLHRDSPKE
jgi:hypothetical protein